MKKGLFYCTLIALVFVSCTNDRSYTAECEVGPSNDGQTAYMLDYHDNSVVDSAVVTDGKFIFTGTISQDSIRRIDLGRKYANLILEPGRIVVDMTGTLLREHRSTRQKTTIKYFMTLYGMHCLRLAAQSDKIRLWILRHRTSA